MGLHKSKNITAARRTADKWLGKYIRLRDASTDGTIQCISCEEILPYGESLVDAGHWIPKCIDVTRYNEYNVNGQCKACNLKEGGMAAWHGKAIQLKYGEDIYEELLHLSKKDVTLTIEQTMEQARKYKQMYEELLEVKNIIVNDK